MILRVTFRTPNAVSDAITDAVNARYPDRDDYGYAELRRSLSDEIEENLKRFVGYDQTVLVGFDTDLKTVTVVPRW